MFKDRRKAKFKSPQVAALAKASAAGSRGIRATEAPTDVQKSEGRRQRHAITQEAKYNTPLDLSRGAAFQMGARRVDQRVNKGENPYGR